MSEHHDPAGRVVFDRDQLRRVAQEATPGPWESNVWDSGLSYRELNASVITVSHGDRVAVCDYDGDAEGPHAAEGKDAYYIATFDPPTVLALLDALEDAERERDQWQAVAEDRRGGQHPAIMKMRTYRRIVRDVEALLDQTEAEARANGHLPRLSPRQVRAAMRAADSPAGDE